MEKSAENRSVSRTSLRPSYLGLNPPRPELYTRINQRVMEMIDSGLLEETKRLLSAGYTTSSPGLRTVGYTEALQYFNDELEYEQMIATIQQATRRYAKRQMTWFRKVEGVHWLEKPDTAAALDWLSSVA